MFPRATQGVWRQNQRLGLQFSLGFRTPKMEATAAKKRLWNPRSAALTPIPTPRFGDRSCCLAL